MDSRPVLQLFLYIALANYYETLWVSVYFFQKLAIVLFTNLKYHGNNTICIIRLSKSFKVFTVVPDPKIVGITVENSMILTDKKLSTM